MNIYFVFEGKTEAVVYKEWLKFLLPNFTEVFAYNESVNNNYYYESDMGVPDCYNVVANAIQEINEHPFYDYLILIIDADRSTIEEKINESHLSIKNKLLEKKHDFKSLPENCQLEIIIQKVCIETWFLGNKKFFKRNPEGEILKEYIKYFDVRKNDPEDLAEEFIQAENGTNKIFGYATKALFHERYLREIFKERGKGQIYSKSKPKHVIDKSYFDEIKNRIKNQHLKSFQSFLDLLEKINQR